MKDETFDYIYELITTNENDIEWWEHKGYVKLSGYIDNLNSQAIIRLMKDSRTWHPDFQFILAESLWKSSVDNAIELYCKIFVEMDSWENSEYMSSVLENLEETDLPKELFAHYLEKMKTINSFQKKQRDGGKIIPLNK
jgi:hypothetical protein